MSEKPLRTSQAAEYLNIHPITLRRWSKEGKIKTYMFGRERRFYKSDLDAAMGIQDEEEPVSRVEAFYVRVSGSTGQETSIVAQKKMLTSSATGTVYKTYQDKGSGLSTKRKGFNRMLQDAQDKKFTVLRITHTDRLTRFGYEYVEQLLTSYGVGLEVLTGSDVPKSDTEELIDDFMALVSSFAGRVYGMRSREHKKMLLDKAGECNAWKDAFFYLRTKRLHRPSWHTTWTKTRPNPDAVSSKPSL